MAMTAMEDGATLEFLGVPRGMGIASEAENQRFFQKPSFWACSVKVMGQYGSLAV